MNRYLLAACLMGLICLPLQAETKNSELFQSYINDNKILGGVETFGLPATGMTLDARIDTGAELSSLDARNIREFKQDQQKWVSFELVDRKNGSSKKLTLPVDRHVKIKRHGAESQCRPVICLLVTLGDRKQETYFSLTDRSKFDYPLLIGRSFLTGQLVDISRNNLAGQPVL